MNGINLNVLKYFPVAPEQASVEAVNYDVFFWFINFLAIFFGGTVVLLLMWLAIKYRRGSTADRRNPIDHHKGIEALVIGVCTTMALVVFFWSMVLYINYRSMPKESKEVFVIGKQWMWHLQHMNGVRENNELHIPVDTNIKFTMISQDVIHAFYLPDFRAQFHVVPGRYTDMWIRPTKTGRFKMLCAMHCGTQHSEMVGWVYVMSKQDFAKWAANGGNRFQNEPMNMVAAGQKVWNAKGCANCHGSVDTTRAPSVFNIYGKARVLDDGVVTADSAYLRDSILTPWRQLTKGYEPTMPAYAGQISEEEVLSLIEYLKSGTNTSVPGQPAPYSPTSQGGTRPSTSAPKSATDIANESESAGFTQSDQGGVPKR